MLTDSRGLGDKKLEGDEGEQSPSSFLSPQTVRIGPMYINVYHRAREGSSGTFCGGVAGSGGFAQLGVDGVEFVGQLLNEAADAVD